MPSVYLVVLHRLMVPGSNRHASEWKRGYSVPGAEELRPRSGQQGYDLAG